MFMIGFTVKGSCITNKNTKEILKIFDKFSFVKISEDKWKSIIKDIRRQKTIYRLFLCSKIKKIFVYFPSPKLHLYCSHLCRFIDNTAVFFQRIQSFTAWVAVVVVLTVGYNRVGRAYILYKGF